MHISQKSRVQQEEADSRDQTYQEDDHQEQKNYIRHGFSKRSGYSRWGLYLYIKNLSPWLRYKKTGSAKLNDWIYNALFKTVIIALNLDLSFAFTSHEKGNRRSSRQKKQFLVFPQTVKHFLERPLSPSYRGMCQCTLQENYFYDKDTYK